MLLEVDIDSAFSSTVITLFITPSSLVFVGKSSLCSHFPSTTNLNSYSPGDKSSLRAHFSPVDSAEFFSISTGSHCVKDPANWTFSTAQQLPPFHSNEVLIVIFHSHSLKILVNPVKMTFSSKNQKLLKITKLPH